MASESAYKGWGKEEMIQELMPTELALNCSL